MIKAFAASLGALVLVSAAMANAVTIVGFAGSSTKGPLHDTLTGTVTSITNAAPMPANNVTLNVGDTDFIPTVSDFVTSASGTFVNATGSTVTFNWYIDRGNAVLQLTELIDTFTFTAPDANESFSHSFMLDLLTDVSSPFSMTLQIIVDLTGAVGGVPSALTNVSSTIDGAILQPNQVPEPGSLALLALGLAGLAAVGCKRTAPA